MTEHAHQTGRTRLRRALGMLATVVSVGLVAGGVFASAGQASQSPSIAFTPNSFGFGSVSSGASSSETFVLKNTGGSASAALTLSLSGSSAFAITADGCTGTSLGPNKSCHVTVTYQPGTNGSTDVATLTATGKKSSATATAALSGNSFVSFMETSCSGVSCNVFASTDTSSVSVAATGTDTSSGTLQAGILAGALSCGTYPFKSLNEDPNTYEVLSSDFTYGKIVTITYPASFTHDTGEASGAYDMDSDFDDVQVCFQATYFTGLLPDCPAAGPCVDRSMSKFTPTDESGIDFEFSMVVDIPPKEPGDPRMN